MNNKFPPKKSGEARKQAGKKEGGWGEGIFARLSEKRSPAALFVQIRTPQKSFLFLLEEKNRRAQIKKCEENFFAGWRGFRAAAGLTSSLGIFRKMGSDFFKQTPQNNKNKSIDSCFCLLL
ncbi:hypothetical protein KJ978_00935 [Patescibacteria group bacterium]|nr:hypothetical protein [Patescibacteria group bacterium]MBU1421030.1 hypothetical protein [Patescibacteria group bacterium]